MTQEKPYYLPIGCITASALYSLAATLNRLSSWHRTHGGQSNDLPCLRAVESDPETKQITAIVYSGRIHWSLILHQGEWIIHSDALKDNLS